MKMRGDIKHTLQMSHWVNSPSHKCELQVWRTCTALKHELYLLKLWQQYEQ